MSISEVKWNFLAFEQLRETDEVKELLEDKGKKLAGLCDSNLDGEKHFTTGSVKGVKQKQGRWFTTVIPTDEWAERAENKHSLMLKNLEGIRDS